MRKILVLDDKPKLLQRLVENISKFEAIPATDIDEAMIVLRTEDISFIAVDYDLGQQKTGDMLYDLLFKTGKSIPAIIFSGKDLSQDQKKDLDSKGFSNVLSKVDDSNHSVSLLIENEAERILSDCKARVYHVLKKVEFMGVGGHPISFENQIKSIDEWITLMAECQIPEDKEKLLKNSIAEHCTFYEEEGLSPHGPP